MTELVAIDVGGTHARFALASVSDTGIELGEPLVLGSQAHASFDSAWAEFRRLRGGPLPRDAALALAGPVTGETITFASIPHWSIRREGLEQRLGMDRIVLVNDFEAVGHAVARAAPEHLRHLAGPEIDLPPSGTLSVVGPGTGLGVAHVWRDGRGAYRVQATEGGHVDFAPVDAVDDAILARLRPRHRRVSVERVVSGPGIVAIYETLATMEGQPVVPAEDKAIWTRAASGEDPLAVAAVERFCLSLGSVAGDLALAQGACGVVIAGGVAQRLADRIARSGFAARFAAKGRFAGLMASLSVKLIVHPQPGLYGAAAAFAGGFA